MSRKNQIIRAVNGEPTQAQAGDEQIEPAQEAERVEETAISDSDDELIYDDASWDLSETEHPRPSRWGLIAAMFAIATILAWSAFYAFATQETWLDLRTATPSVWARLIIDWSVPVLLVCVVWILAMRNSTREANRFAASASLLSQESAQLEERLTIVNRELSLAREFLASQSRDLETLGRIAAERLSTNAQELQSLIHTNGAQVEAIGTTSQSALSNMTRLRDDLPVIANSARDMNNQVGSTGRTAREQLDQLISGFERLNQFGTASENQVSALSTRIDETVTSFEAQLQLMEQALAERFTALQDSAESYRGAVNEAESEALEAMQERIGVMQEEAQAIGARLRESETQGVEQVRSSRERWEQELGEMVARLSQLDEQAMRASQMRIRELNEEAGRFDDQLKQRDVRFFEAMNRRQDDFATRETQATESLTQRITQLDDMLAAKREGQALETEKLVAHTAQMTEQLDTLSTMIASVKDLGANTRSGLMQGMDELGESLDAKKASLQQTEASLAAITDASVRMLEIIQSGAKHSREDLPEAIGTAAQALSQVEQRSAALGGAMFSIGQKADELSNYLITTKDGIDNADLSIAALQERVAERSEEALAKLNGLHSGFERLSQNSHTFANETQEALIASISKLEEATTATIATLEDGAKNEVTGIAERLSADAITALERALRNDRAETIGKLEQAAAHASGVGKEAALQLQEGLDRVHELTTNLEQRIDDAKDLAEEQVDNDFARRAALISDSLNSAAIDISSALSTEIADTAWDAFLKGDRGIFTRRTVRLLEGGEARAIADLYQNDEAFKANVSRYIHDFETMLRSMLATRDGNALSVTMLGSDMGKLYVALAQSIERFRK